MRSMFFKRVAVCALLPAICAVAAVADASDLVGPETLGTLPLKVSEASGLAVSRRDSGILWTHEDSGGQPVLEAIARDGAPRGRLRIAGVKNVDWEDIASFTLDGKAWLLVADTGDNKAGRGDCSLLVVEEPEPAKLVPGKETVVEIAWRIPVIYPDGPRDCEAVAVDAGEGKVYLLAKRVTPHGLYTLPLRPAAPGQVAPAAERVGDLPAFPAAEEAQRLLPTPSGMYRAQPTGMDFSADGFAAVIVTYGDVLVYPRRYDELWSTALGRTPIRLAPHGLTQAEAICFSADGREIFATSEGKGAPLLRYRLR